MPNQYTGNFETIINDKFQCSAGSLLQQWACEGITYCEAARRLGLKVVTVRKWARRYGVKLASQRCLQARRKENVFTRSLQEKQLNVHNFLSRRWGVV